MRFIYFFAIICLFAWLGSASPLNPKRRLINRPSEDELFQLNRHRRTAIDHETAKGGKQSSNQRSLESMEMNLRKGEYICHGKVCKLKPGEVPRGCNGSCQHRI